jgi:hypothetical protein
MSDEEIYSEYELEQQKYREYRKEATGQNTKGRVYPTRVKKAKFEWVEQSQKLLALLDGRRTALIEVIGRVMKERGGYVKRK